MKFVRIRWFVKTWLMNRRFKSLDGLSRRVARWLTDHWTANQITLLGVALCVPMTALFWADLYFPASVLLTLSLLTDFADGALAHYQQGLRPPMSLEEERRLTLKQRIDYRGVTHLGKAFDPVVDKVRFFCVVYALGWGIVNTGLVIALTVVAVTLTVIRPIKRWMKMGDARSNRFGKFKIWAEIAALALLIIHPTSTVLLHLTFAVALAFGCFSLLGHLLAAYVALRTRRASRRRSRASRRVQPATVDS